ncbi:hypothetical protein BDZ89DRAFT_1160818 [Hymenopellis radicata]|nr:hypothetical protein BDZ89DRAFT_1160818 [Hymenopellis radicata]
MTAQPDTVLLACEHKFHCIVDGKTFADALDAILKAHADSQCPCILGSCDRAWISPRPLMGPDNVLPDNATIVPMDRDVDMYEPDMVWFGSAWDSEPQDYAHVNPNCRLNSSASSGSSQGSSTFTFTSREAFIAVRPGLLRCGIDHNVPMRLPPSEIIFTNASRLNGNIWIDKTESIQFIDRLGAPLSLIRRPAGFGKTCFSMMNFLYQSAWLSHSDTFRDMFGATKIASCPGAPDSNGLLGLHFDLGEVARAAIEDFKAALLAYVQGCMFEFIGQNAALLESCLSEDEEPHPPHLYKDGHLGVSAIPHLIGKSGWSLYVVIDNYDAPARVYKNNTKVMRLIESVLIRPLSDLGRLVFDGLILGDYVEGDDGDYADEGDDENWTAPGPWSQISNDYTRHPYVNAAFGLSVDEIAWLCKAVSPTDHLLLGKIVQDVRGYQFGPNVDLTYNTRDVINAIRARTDGGEAAVILK